MEDPSLIDSILETSDIIFFALDNSYCYTKFSKKHYDIMGKIWNIDIAVNINMLECINDSKDRKKAKDNFDRALKGESFTLKEEYGDNKLFRSSWENDYFPIYQNAEIIGVGVVVKDLSLDIEKERREIFQKLLNMTKSGVTIADAQAEDMPLIFTNDAFETLTGYKRADSVGKNLRFLHGDDKEQSALKMIKDAIVNQKSCEVKIRNYKKDGTLFYNLLVLTPLFSDDGVLLYYAGFQNDITDLYQLQEELKRQAYMDELTHAYNRKAFNEKLTENMVFFKRYRRAFCIALFDIDDFKSVNDSYGHDMGDKVLVELSSHIHSTIRKSDLFFRVGGEEFIIIFHEISSTDAFDLMEKIRLSIENLRIIADRVVTISIGLTQVKEADDKDLIYKRVDDLLYKSKKTGKNRISLF